MMKTLLVAAAIAIPMAGVATASDVENRTDPEIEDMAFDHMSINVADFDGAMTWYQDKLGFEVDVSWRVEALNGKQLAYLSLGDTVIELVAADEGGRGLPVAATFQDHFARTGYGHLCFSVEDVDATLARLEEKGVPVFVTAETYALDETPYERRVGFIQDPEGNVIEFAESLRIRQQ
ncbi:MAG: VOC family protein [Pseudomonadota bacterium]